MHSEGFAAHNLIIWIPSLVGHHTQHLGLFVVGVSSENHRGRFTAEKRQSANHDVLAFTVIGIYFEFSFW